MTIKNELLERSYNPEHKRSLILLEALSNRLCFSFFIICISLPLGCIEASFEDIDPLDLLDPSLAADHQDVKALDNPDYSNLPSRIRQPDTQITMPPSSKNRTDTNGNVAVNLTAKAGKKVSHLLISKNPTTDLSRQLWQTRITTFEDQETGKGKNELKQVIEQVNSVEFKPQSQASKPLIVVKLLQNAEPNEISSGTKSSKEKDPEKIESKLSYGQLTDQTLEILKTLSQNPDKIHDPFELAEILFNRNYLEEAAKCYQQALNRLAENQSDRLDDKAWLLFQIGNCLRNKDQSKANQMYKQLIAEYPDSPWTGLAKAKSKLIDWYLKDKPNTLIKKLEL